MKPLLSFLVPLLIVPAAMAATLSSPAADQTQAIQDSNAFAVDLYAQLEKQQGNLFFSPESISTAFGMAYAGARGPTATQMQHVLHFTLPPDRLHPAMGALLAALNGQHSGYELHSADALWAEQDASFLPDYLKLVQTDYGAGFRGVDFKNSPEAARAAINQWVEDQTNKKIENLLGPGTVTPATRLILTNAIYFKGAWLDEFDLRDTEAEDFHLTAKQTVKTQMMNRTGAGYEYYDGGSFQEIELPYKGGCSMIVLLPKAMDGLSSLERSFTAANASAWIKKLKPTEKVILSFPRFTLTQEFELSGTLKQMGLPLAFSGSADFSGMDGKRDFAIAAAIHKAYVDVTEEGTEAAAATAITFYATAMRRDFPEPPPIVFRADHPFVFMIYDNGSGSILFMGRVSDPTK